jgi:hypothetical protein
MRISGPPPVGELPHRSDRRWLEAALAGHNDSLRLADGTSSDFIRAVPAGDAVRAACSDEAFT